MLHIVLRINRLHIDRLIEQYKGLSCDHEQIRLNLFLIERGSFVKPNFGKL